MLQKLIVWWNRDELRRSVFWMVFWLMCLGVPYSIFMAVVQDTFCSL